MTRDRLRTAGELLIDASRDADGDLRERIEGLAEQLDDLADADRGPDHGRIARMENALNEIEAQLDGDARENVRDAHEHLSEYRSTVSGV
jgi:ABC-type transporter Mla subunit MlaD